MYIHAAWFLEYVQSIVTNGESYKRLVGLCLCTCYLHVYVSTPMYEVRTVRKMKYVLCVAAQASPALAINQTWIVSFDETTSSVTLSTICKSVIPLSPALQRARMSGDHGLFSDRS
jgi:hypothetical protein